MDEKSHEICGKQISWQEIIKLSQHDIKDLHINIDEEIKIVEKEDNISLAKNQIDKEQLKEKTSEVNVCLTQGMFIIIDLIFLISIV